MVKRKIAILALCLLFIPSFAVAQTEIDISFSTSQGVTNKQQTIIDVTRAKRNTELSAQWRYAETEDVRVEEKGLVRGEYNRPVSDSWSIWSYEQAGYDVAREIVTENFLGAGPKYTFLATKELNISLSVGGLHHWVTFEDGTQESLCRASIRPKFRGEWERWRAEAWIFYQPVVENWHDFILHGRASLRYAITDRVGLKFSAENEYRSMSVGERNNLIYSTALSWGF